MNIPWQRWVAHTWCQPYKATMITEPSYLWPLAVAGKRYGSAATFEHRFVAQSTECQKHCVTGFVVVNCLRRDQSSAVESRRVDEASSKPDPFAPSLASCRGSGRRDAVARAVVLALPIPSATATAFRGYRVTSVTNSESVTLSEFDATASPTCALA